MTRPSSLFSGVLATVCLTLVGVASSNPVPAVTVTAGQSIQSAIDAAPAGATIVVKAGTYAEQLTITKDGTTLIGQKAVIVPPANPITNLCSGTTGNGSFAGICVAGKDVKLLPFDTEHQAVSSVGQRVKGVSISGFEVNGFPGENIALYGAEDSSVSNNKLVDGLRYGYLAAGSINTDARGNKVYSTGLVPNIGFRFIAMCSDNPSGATVWANDIDGYGIGLCVQTNGANIQHNHVTNHCYGVFVDPGVTGAIVRHNTIGPTNPACQFAFGVASGIVLGGAINTDVQHNTVGEQTLGTAATATNAAAGILVFDDPKSNATGNQVVRNDIAKSDVDLADFSPSSSNVFKKNTCTTSFPAGLCT